MRDQIFNEDCLTGMDKIPDGSVDMILCDLPYGTTQNKWDTVIPFEPLWKHFWRILKENGAVVLTAQQPFATDLINSCRKRFRYEIIWEKTQVGGFLNAKKMPLRCHENIFLFYKKLPTYNPQKTQAGKATGRVRGELRGDTSTNYHYYKKADYKYVEDGSRHPRSVVKISNWNGVLFGNNSKAVKHPTQKPVELFRWLIRTYSNPGEVVLDACIGSGTTAVAALMEGRQYIGFEKEEKYFRIAQNRIAEAQQTLFTTSEK